MMDDVDRATWTGTAGRGDTPAVASPRAAARRGVAVVLLVATAVVGGALAGPWDPVLRSEGPQEPLPQPSLTPPPPPPDPLVESLREMDVRPWDLTGLAQVLAAAVLLGLLYLVVRWLRALPPPRVEVPGDPGDVVPGEITDDAGVLPDLPALREGVEGADAHLRAQVPPADAVIAAWVALEEGAAGSGIVRDPASTPTEFTVTVLDRAPVDPAATRTLLALYLRARFGEEAMTAADVAAATAAVRTLAAGLSASSDADATPGADGDTGSEPSPETDPSPEPGSGSGSDPGREAGGAT